MERPSPKKHARLRERGLVHAIDYTCGDWEQEFARLTEGKEGRILLQRVKEFDFVRVSETDLIWT